MNWTAGSLAVIAAAFRCAPRQRQVRFSQDRSGVYAGTRSLDWPTTGLRAPGSTRPATSPRYGRVSPWDVIGETALTVSEEDFRFEGGAPPP